VKTLPDKGEVIEDIEKKGGRDGLFGYQYPFYSSLTEPLK